MPSIVDDVPLLPALVLAGLGAFHGVNPAMGWLLAVALGLQARSRPVMWRALAALGAGHALAIGIAIVAAGIVTDLIPAALIRVALALSLVTLGATRLVRSRHPRAGGMRMGAAGLAGWSFIMASAHGAGLMVLPFVIAPSATASAHGGHAHHAAAATIPVLWATILHGMGYVIATVLVAWVVYEKLGVGVIRRAWVNLDVIWAVALLVTGVFSLLM